MVWGALRPMSSSNAALTMMFPIETASFDKSGADHLAGLARISGGRR